MTSRLRSPGQGGIASPPPLRTGTGPAGVAAAIGATTPTAGTGPAGGMPAGLVQRVLERLAANGSVASDTAGLRAAVAEALAEDGIVLPPRNLAAIVTSIGDELTGLGPLAPLLADPAVTDVLVNGPTEVWVERGGTIERAAVRFPSSAAVAALVQRVVAPLGLRVDESRPWVDARLPGGERFHAVLPPLAPDGPVVTIRTFARRRLQLRDLIERDALDEVTARLLEAMVAAGVAIAVSGATGTGKTTLLNVLERHLSVSHELPIAFALLTTKLLGSMVEIVAEGGHRGVLGRRVAWPISMARSWWVRAPARSTRSASTVPRLLCEWPSRGGRHRRRSSGCPAA
jgi:pilus assembly protein CpaF